MVLHETSLGMPHSNTEHHEVPFGVLCKPNRMELCNGLLRTSKASTLKELNSAHFRGAYAYIHTYTHVQILKYFLFYLLTYPKGSFQKVGTFLGT